MVWPSLRPPHQWQADVPSARAPLAAVTHATTHVRAPWPSLAIPGQPRSSHVTCANVSPALHRPPSLCRDRAMTWGPCQPPPRGGPWKHRRVHPSFSCSALGASVAKSWPGTRANRTHAPHSPRVPQVSPQALPACRRARSGFEAGATRRLQTLIHPGKPHTPPLHCPAQPSSPRHRLPAASKWGGSQATV